MRALFLPIAALALASCGNSGETVATSGEERSAFEVENDYAIGSPDAPVTVVEYASVACGACGSWHNTVYPEFKEQFVDTGRVRFVLREFPTGQQTVFNTGTRLAVCAEEKRPGGYLDSASLQFERQNEIFRYLQQAPAQLRDQYRFIASEAGLSEEEMMECLESDEVLEKMKAKFQLGEDAGVTGTPAFFINGERTNARTLEEFEEAIADAEGSASG